ncbi:MAG: hypothetical protein AAF918_17600 [Pseudomonadota bacterium]
MHNNASARKLDRTMSKADIIAEATDRSTPASVREAFKERLASRRPLPKSLRRAFEQLIARDESND